MADDVRLPMNAANLCEGMQLGPIFYLVRREQIEAFAAATGAGNSLFAADSPQELVAPPTMRLRDYALLIATRFRGGTGGVHAKHWSEFHAPMRAGQAVRTEGRIAKVWSKRGKFYFELEYESRDAASGELLVRQAITSVLLNEGKIA